MKGTGTRATSMEGEKKCMKTGLSIQESITKE